MGFKMKSPFENVLLYSAALFGVCIHADPLGGV